MFKTNAGGDGTVEIELLANAFKLLSSSNLFNSSIWIKASQLAGEKHTLLAYTSDGSK